MFRERDLQHILLHAAIAILVHSVIDLVEM